MFGGMLRYGCMALALGVGTALAQEAPVKMFKIITAKDEVVIGLTDPNADVAKLAEKLVSAGQVSVWQYAVKRAADGSMVQAPLRRVAILKSDTLRIEPYDPKPLKALPHQ